MPTQAAAAGLRPEASQALLKSKLFFPASGLWKPGMAPAGWKGSGGP